MGLDSAQTGCSSGMSLVRTCGLTHVKVDLILALAVWVKMENPQPKAKYVLTTGVSDTKGRRETMEDTHVVFDQVESFQDAKQVAFYGCYDGHGGVHCFWFTTCRAHT